MPLLPTRRTSEQELDLWNQQMRASPIYQQFMRSQGLATDGRVRLSREQQSALEKTLEAHGMRIPSGMHIDQGGNLNQKNRTARNIAIGVGIGTAAALTGGAALGAFGASGAGAAGAGAGAAGAGAAGAGAGLGAAGTAGLLGTTGWVAPMAAYAAPVAASGIGAGAAAAGSGLLGSTLLNAGVGAAQGGMNGGGVRGALLGAATGAATGGLGGGIGGGAAGMSWQSTLANIARDPNTWATVAGAIGSNMSRNRDDRNNAASRADDRQNDQYRTLQQALIQLLLAGSNENRDNARIDLDQRRFALDAPRERGRQALLGSLLQNMQPVRFSGLSPQLQARMPQITGGLTPAALGPQARQMGALMQQNAVSSQQRGDQFSALPRTNFLAGLLPPPQMSGHQGPGRLEALLGLIGMGAGIYGQYRNRNNGGNNTSVNNAMPSPYTGLDMYGNAANWMLPQGTLQPAPRNT